ncbi:hypothetical protein [Serratia sp. (in: enterobacteria)]|uniref:hypothetical protein n=1 Tax=Serratia sp. (in: enterobacteria) TaxID=616 RepID=UPI0039898350
MEESQYKGIRKEILLYARDMNQWWKNLQKDSIAEWLLLTTIGCWGIPDHFFQKTAFILTIIFFSGKLLKISNKRSFSKHESKIKNRITLSSLRENEKSSLLFRLEKIKKFRRTKNTIFIFKRTWRFLLGYIFLMASCFKIFSTIF